MTVKALINCLESLIGEKPFLADSEVRISAETADYGTIDKIEFLSNDKLVDYYRASESELELTLKGYIYLTAQH